MQEVQECLYMYLLSSMHVNPTIDPGVKSKPKVVKFYNTEKCSVDAVDSMLRMMSCRSATRRWPVAVWQNLLDIAALNGWIIYREVTGSKISCKEYLLSLIKELTKVQDIHGHTGFFAIKHHQLYRSSNQTKEM